MKKRLYAIYQGPAGYDKDKRDFEKLEKTGELQIGKIYVVKKVDMKASMTHIDLEGVSGKRLNSVAFDFYYMINNKLEEHDIYDDKKYNPYLSDNLNTL